MSDKDTCPNGAPHDWAVFKYAPTFHRRCRYCGAHGTVNYDGKLHKEPSAHVCDTDGCESAAVVYFDGRWWCDKHRDRKIMHPLDPNNYPPDPYAKDA